MIYTIVLYFMPTVLIVVVTYNGQQHISSCLSPLKGMPENMKCVVIDNDSTDGTPHRIKSDYQFVELIETGKNLGFGAANNIGLRKAINEGYDYVYLLNQDAWIEKDDIWALVQIAERNPEYGIISPLQVYADNKKIDNNFSHNLSKEMKDDFFLSGNTQKELYLTIGVGLQAAHWLLRVSTILKAGVFSPSFFHYGEDTNLCRRAEFHGIKLGITPQILGVHNRENRLKSPSLKFYMAVNNWVQIVSDPKLPLKSILNLLIKDLFNTFLDYPVKFTPAFLKFIVKIPGIWHNRKVSMHERAAFLIET